MTTSRTSTHRTVTEARLPTPATLFVCAKCSGGRDLRRAVRSAVKAAGRKRDLRVTRTSCLDVCPKRGSAAVFINGTRAARCIIVEDAAAIGGVFVANLLDERARDAVAD